MLIFIVWIMMVLCNELRGVQLLYLVSYTDSQFTKSLHQKTFNTESKEIYSAQNA